MDATHRLIDYTYLKQCGSVGSYFSPTFRQCSPLYHSLRNIDTRRLFCEHTRLVYKR
jgi:hypothetical protein